jgi:acyl dehydratase
MPQMLTMTLDQLRDARGKEVACTEWFTVTQEQIDSFAAATGDRQWIHVDRERSRRESPYGETIAHGFLTLALLSQCLRQAIEVQDADMVINYGLNRVRFPAPVLAGSTVRARFTLHSVKDAGEAIGAVFAVVMEGQKGVKPVCAAEWVVRFYGRREFLAERTGL